MANHATHTLTHSLAFPVTPQAMLDAKELPPSQLSKYLEGHMANAIQQERIMRAQSVGMEPHLVPGAEGLTVRVVNNVVKRCVEAV